MNSCNKTIQIACANPDNIDTKVVGSTVMDWRNTGGDLFTKMRACKLALDTYRWYMGSGGDPSQDPNNPPPGHPATTILAASNPSVNADASAVRSLAL